MPSSSAAQHRWIGYLHSNPAAAKKAGMSPSKVQEWLDADRGSPWKRAEGGEVEDVGPPDFTDRYNTPLSPGQEQNYQNWAAGRSKELGRDVNNDLFDYDVRGQWLAGQAPKAGEHGADTFKKPNHPTFSEYSQYNGADGNRGGQWTRQGDAWAYRPSQTNLDMHGSAGLQDYFSKREPGNRLIMPGQAAGGIVRRDGGGQIPDYSGGSGGITEPAPTAQNQNPIAQGMIQKYSGMPDEQLQELAARLGGTSQGQMIQQLLQRRRMMSQTTQQQPASPLSQPLKKGGTVKRDSGGMMSSSEASPWWTRREASGADSGFLHGSTPGRADQVKTQALPGAYIVPADVVSGLGEGNSLAGASAIQAAINSGPWGTPLPRMRGRSTIPRSPPAEHSTYKTGGEVPIFEATPRARGGANTGMTPVDLSDGEFCISPKDCERFGNGDRAAGHRWWDDWVMRQRKKHIKTLQSLPPPVKP